MKRWLRHRAARRLLHWLFEECVKDARKTDDQLAVEAFLWLALDEERMAECLIEARDSPYDAVWFRHCGDPEFHDEHEWWHETFGHDGIGKCGGTK